MGLRARLSLKHSVSDHNDDEEECRPWRRRLFMAFTWRSALKIAFLLLLLAAIVTACFTLPIEKVSSSCFDQFFLLHYRFSFCMWLMTIARGFFLIDMAYPFPFSFPYPSALELCLRLKFRLWTIWSNYGCSGEGFAKNLFSLHGNFWIYLFVFKFVECSVCSTYELCTWILLVGFWGLRVYDELLIFNL